MAPIVLFTYKRPEALARTIEALQRNEGARESVLYVFSDGARAAQDAAAVAEVRAYLRGISGFRQIFIKEAPTNKGLAASVIDGVTEVIREHGRVIVLEDDLVTAPNFLAFMNAALDAYAGDPRVFSVSGYTLPVRAAGDVYFTQRASSWGWATWADRWSSVDWAVEDYAQFSRDALARRRFNRIGSDLSDSLRKQMEGRIHSWAIRWVYNQFKQDKLSVFPTLSKVINIGFDGGATHTRRGQAGRFSTELDRGGALSWNFTEPTLDPSTVKQFAAYYSLPVRLKYKLIQWLPS
ncbi:glycosyltransferase family protein [Dinghuibacter silviterrae]|uniref:Glycosyl transferase family 2 n=1 Tax=Dinghuibacter silviterrae TaxID=1539049 RepID=A0A4R8DUX2_9BACT|nr:glycosyltransferase [Dinghuibacter silviterrae]TDX01766.1 glycosyl transferase family 2 [Dinghuibacter silviterrae]